MYLEGEKITFGYNHQNIILNEVDIKLASGEVIGLIGDSGSGKSTLCKILAGYIENYEGNVTLDRKKIHINDYNPVQLIFQHPEKAVNPRWKMKQVLNESYSPSQDSMDLFGIKQNWLNRWPNELSGGELQRFAVLRALNPKTKFLIADEITTMVDAITQVQIWENILEMTDKLNIGVLMVSHDKKLIQKVCQDSLYFKDINKS